MTISSLFSTAKQLVIAFCVLALAACGGTSDGGNSSNPGAGATPTPTITATPEPTATASPSPTAATTPEPSVSPSPTPAPSPSVSLATVQADVFDEFCAGCHEGDSAPRGLRLDSEQNSFNFLVNVASDEVPTLLLVDPGNPDDSYLVRKIEGGPDIVGQRMPRGQDPLSDVNIAKVRDWIAAGAQQSAGVTTSVKVLTAEFSEEDNIASVEFLLSGPLDERTLSSGSLTLSTIENGQKQIQSADGLTFSIHQNRLSLSFDKTRYVANSFEIQLNDPTLSAVLDANGRLLDGDGNLQDGGAFIYKFSLTK